MTDFSHEAYVIQLAVAGAMGRIEEAALHIETAWTAPNILMRPKLLRDGDMWCALYGENLVEGVAGFGETPLIAMNKFDIAWRTLRTPGTIPLAA